VTRSAFPQVVTELRGLLGTRLVAYLGEAGETRIVDQWADGTVTPRDGIQQRLRLALQLAVSISRADSSAIAQAWFQGANPHTEDRAPAGLLRDGDLNDVGPIVLAAGRAFVLDG
jgi:hypothetical protein